MTYQIYNQCSLYTLLTHLFPTTSFLFNLDSQRIPGPVPDAASAAGEHLGGQPAASAGRAGSRVARRAVAPPGAPGHGHRGVNLVEGLLRTMVGLYGQ